MSKPTVLIGGAGIAGLTAALSLAHYGISSTIIETFDEPQEVGAGIQISPNSWRILKALGLAPALDAVAIKPTHIRLGDAHNGKIVLNIKVNRPSDSDQIFGVIHRAALHKILWDAATQSKLIEIMTSTTIDEVHEAADGVEILCRTKTGVSRLSASALIGADGIWSNVRRFVPGAAMPQATGRIALRAMVPARSAFDSATVTAWMARKSHIVAYPVNDTDTLNVVAIINGAAHQTTWDHHFDGPLPPDLRARLTQLSTVDPHEIAFTRWPLLAVSLGGKWHSDHICLIGDAAHGIEPFAAQGSAMAIEDAFELAWFMRDADLEAPRKAFDGFYARRAPRVAKVAKRTELNRFAYHQSGLGRWGRNFLFAAQPSDKFLASLRWLYGYMAKGL